MEEFAWEEILSAEGIAKEVEALISARLRGECVPKADGWLLERGVATPVYEAVCPSCGVKNTGHSREAVCVECGEKLDMELVGYTMAQRAYDSLKKALSLKDGGIKVVPLTVAPSRPSTGVVVNISPLIDTDDVMCTDPSGLSVFAIPWKWAATLLADPVEVLGQVLSLRKEIISRIVETRTSPGMDIRPLIEAYLYHKRKSCRVERDGVVMGKKLYLIHPIVESDWREIAAAGFKAGREGYDGIVAFAHSEDDIPNLEKKLKYTGLRTMFIIRADLVEAALSSRTLLRALEPWEGMVESFNRTQS